MKRLFKADGEKKVNQFVLICSLTAQLSVTVKIDFSACSICRINLWLFFPHTVHSATEFIRNRRGGKRRWWQQWGRGRWLCRGGRWEGKAEGRQDRIQTEKDSHLQGTKFCWSLGQCRYNGSTGDEVAQNSLSFNRFTLVLESFMVSLASNHN